MTYRTSITHLLPAIADNRNAGPVIRLRAANANEETPNRIQAKTIACADCASALVPGEHRENGAETYCYRYRSHCHGTRPVFADTPATQANAMSRKGLLP